MAMVEDFADAATGALGGADADVLSCADCALANVASSAANVTAGAAGLGLWRGLGALGGNVLAAGREG
jgi:hypothetical protein